MAKDNTKRFSNRVDNYVKYRPHYPAEIIDFLQDNHGLSTDKLIADIGAGTGISSELFLNAGYRVVAVEPNTEMRDKAIELLGASPNFKAVNGTAEHTTLQAGSFGAVIAGQAFHWFNAPNTRVEFKRILKPGGIIVLIWNERKTESAFEQEYDQLIIKHGQDYVKLQHRNINTDHIAAFYKPKPFELRIFQNKQLFDFQGLTGRLISSSYMPVKGQPAYEPMINDLEALFNKKKQDNTITINYDTRVYVGKL